MRRKVGIRVFRTNFEVTRLPGELIRSKKNVRKLTRDLEKAGVIEMMRISLGHFQNFAAGTEAVPIKCLLLLLDSRHSVLGELLLVDEADPYSALFDSNSLVIFCIEWSIEIVAHATRKQHIQY